MSNRREHHYYRQLKQQYKRFLDNDRYRIERNEKILRLIERVETRASMLAAKTDRFNILRKQYLAYLRRTCNMTNMSEENRLIKEPTPPPELPKAKMSPYESKMDILEKYLANIASEKTKEEILDSIRNKHKATPNMQDKDDKNVQNALKTTYTLNKPEEFYSGSFENSNYPTYTNSLEYDGAAANREETDMPKFGVRFHQDEESSGTAEEKFEMEAKETEKPTNRDTSTIKIENDSAEIISPRLVKNSDQRKSVPKEGFDEVDFPMGITEQTDYSEVKDVSRSQEVSESPDANLNKLVLEESNHTQQEIEDKSEIALSSKDMEITAIDATKSINRPDEIQAQNDYYNNQQYYDENQYQYDQSGQPISYNYDTNNIQQYDANGQLVQQYDANGQLVQQYDSNGQPVQQYGATEQPYQEYDDNAQPAQQYDANENQIQQYDVNGQPIMQQHDGNVQPLQQYDTNGQQYDRKSEPLQQQDGNNNGQQVQQHHDNNNSGQPVHQIEADSQPVVEYDPIEQQIQQYDANDQQYDANHQQYDANGQQHDANGQPIEQYDANGQPIQQYDANAQQYDENGQPVLQYDEHGQIVHGYDPNVQYDVQYDEQGQPIYDPNVQYDASGQLNQDYDPNLQYDENGQPIGGYGVQYDENGQPIEYDPNAQYDYNQHFDPNVQYDENGQPIPYEASYEQERVQEVEASGEAGEAGEAEKKNVMEMLDTDTESAKQDTKTSNESDFDFSK